MSRWILLCLVAVSVFQSFMYEAAARPSGSYAQQFRPSSEIRDYCVPDLPLPSFCVDKTLRNTFLINRIVPELVGNWKFGLGVKVAYEGRVDVVATYVNKTVAATVPDVNFSNTSKSAFYTLAMLDPDASSRWNATNGPILHWLVTNIADGNVTTGFPVAPYRGPGPAVGNGLHRYVLLAMGQKKGAVNVLPINVTDPTSRRNFDLVKLIADNYLEPLGCTFFFSQF